MWVVTAGRTVVLVTAAVNLVLVDRWICIAVAADGALAWFFHVSDTVFPLPVALRPLGAAGGPTTVRVKDWMAPGIGVASGMTWVTSRITPLVAMIVNLYVPPVFAAGVPASVAVPSPLSVNVSLDGSLPSSGQGGGGHPGRPDSKGPGLADDNVVWSALVIRGFWRTMRVKNWLSGLATFLAVTLNVYTPPVVGVPESVAVPSPLSFAVSPGGRLRDSDNVHVGHPVDVAVKVPGLADGKGGAVGAGDLARLVDREGEALGGGRSDTVRGGDRERVRTAGIRSRCSRKCRRAVPVVRERDSRRQGGAPSDSVELGTPVVMTVKVPSWPVVKAVPVELVIPDAWRTWRLKVWVASGVTPFVAVIVSVYVPPEPAAGVPASVAVPSPLSVNVTPDGSMAAPSRTVRT